MRRGNFTGESFVVFKTFVNIWVRFFELLNEINCDTKSAHCRFCLLKNFYTSFLFHKIKQYKIHGWQKHWFGLNTFYAFSHLTQKYFLPCQPSSFFRFSKKIFRVRNQAQIIVNFYYHIYNYSPPSLIHCVLFFLHELCFLVYGKSCLPKDEIKICFEIQARGGFDLTNIWGGFKVI